MRRTAILGLLAAFGLGLAVGCRPPLVFAGLIAGGILLLLGSVTRPAAFILAGEMAVAYWQFHAPRGILPVQNQGDGSFLLCFICLFLGAYGAGKFSVDGYKRTPVTGRKKI